jgi:Uma2 family endonuclease
MLVIPRGYETRGGCFVEKRRTNRDRAVVANLVERLRPFVRRSPIGRVGTSLVLRFTPRSSDWWRPDAVYVSFDRWPAIKAIPGIDPWDVVPDLCVEVVSHTNLADDIQDRLQAYFGGGVRQVWVIYPRHERVYLYESETMVRILTPADTIDGGALFPGFQMPVRDLFADMGDPPPT